MKTKRRYWGIAALLTSPLLVLYFFGIHIRFDIPLPWEYLLPLLCVLAPLVCGTVWALKNEVRRYRAAQTLGFVLLFAALAFVCSALWNPMAGTAAMLAVLRVVYAVYPLLVLGCFLYPVVDARKRRSET